MKKFATFLWAIDTLSCFKQVPSNVTANLELWV